MEFYFRNGLAESTQRAYNSAKRRYIHFCSIHNLSPIPSSERQLCHYVSYLAIANLSHNTIKAYLSAVRHLHIAEQAADPGISKMPRLEHVLRGVKYMQARGERKGKARLPISIDILHKLREAWQRKASRDSVMLWAAASLCFFGFFRSGEITVPSESGYDKGAHLNFEDVTVDDLANPQVLQVRIKASKTDPFRTGVEVFVGRTRCSMCPVAAVLAYMVTRGAGPGPLFKFSNGKPLTRSRFVTGVKEALEQVALVTRATAFEAGRRRRQ